MALGFTGSMRRVYEKAFVNHVYHATITDSWYSVVVAIILMIIYYILNKKM
jgi:hypothetical protein